MDAVDKYGQVLAIFEKACGKAHDLTATAHYNLGHALLAKGTPAAA